MSEVLRASAPGKMLLSGEYAVLSGAPAVVLAVDRRVEVRLRAGDGRIRAPELGFEARVHPGPGGNHLVDADGRPVLGLTGRFLPRLLAMQGIDSAAVTGLDIDIDSGALYERQPDGGLHKLGLGSSAAVSAALALALLTRLRPEAVPATPQARLNAWLPVYRDALGTAASGADLAAALHGGCLIYRLRDQTGRACSVQLPADLQWVAVWTGHSARTPDFVAAFERWRQQDADSPACLAALARLAERTARSIGDAGAVIDLAAAWVDQLEALGARIGKRVISEPHRRFARLAAECAVGYKSCGAGGGDLGIALAREARCLEAFCTRLATAGGIPLKLAVSEAGARIEEPPAE